MSDHCDMVSELTRLIGIVVWWTNFNSCGEVEDDTILACTGLTPRSFDRLAHLNGELGLRLREALRTVFISEDGAVLCCALFCQLLDDFGVLDRERHGLFL